MVKDSHSSPQVSVVIVSYQSAGELDNAISPLISGVQKGTLEVLVVDNASTDDSLEVLGKYPEIEVIPLDQNIGFGRANNIGWRHARAPLVLFLNPDAAINGGDIQTLASFMNADPKVGVCAPRVIGRSGHAHKTGGLPRLPGDFRRLLRGYQDKRISPDEGQIFKVDWVSGALFLARKAMLQQVNGFDEKFFLYFEETDLAFRAQRLGWTYWLVGTAIAEHSGGKSARQTNQPLVSGAIAQHFYPSRFYYYGKNFSWIGSAVFETCTRVKGLMKRMLTHAEDQTGAAGNPLLHTLRGPHADELQWSLIRTDHQPVACREAGTAEISRISQFLQETFVRWPRFPITTTPEEFIAWKFCSFGTKVGSLMEQGGDALAFTSRTPFPVLLQGQALTATQGADTSVSPLRQGQGLYHRFQVYRDAWRLEHGVTYDVAVGFSTNSTILNRRAGQGRESIWVTEYRVVLNPGAFAAISKLVHNAILPQWLITLRLRLKMKRISRTTSQYRESDFRPIQRFDEKTDDLFLAYSQKFVFSVNKQADYMNWRYIDCPRDYRIIGLYAAEELLGYIVYVLDPEATAIAELVAIDPAVAEELLRFVLAVAESEDAPAMRIWLRDNHPYTPLVHKLGFRPLKQISASIRWSGPENKRIDCLHEPDALLNISMGDADWV